MSTDPSLTALRASLRATTRPLDENAQQLLKRLVRIWFDPLSDTPLMGVPVKTSIEIARLAAGAATIAALTCDKDDRAIFSAARHTFIATIDQLHPVSMPPSWRRLSHYASAVYMDLTTDDPHAPTTKEWDAAINTRIREAARSKLSAVELNLSDQRQDMLITERLRRQGLLSALEHLDVVRRLIVTVRPSSPAASTALHRLFVAPDKTAMAVTNPKSLDLTRDCSPPAHHGLHCTQIFGPITEGECLCGYYRDASKRVCPRCGVIAGPVALRLERSGVITMPGGLTNPLTSDPLDAVPVVPAALRPYDFDGQHITIDQLDVLYARLVVLSGLASRSRALGYATARIDHLLRDALTELAEISRIYEPTPAAVSILSADHA